MDNVRELSFKIFLVFCLIFFPLALSCLAAGNPVKPSNNTQVSQSSQNKDIPAWVKRIEFSTQIETDQKPIVYFQTVQPFYQNEDKTNTFFIQPRYSLQGGRSTSNLGLGYRRLASDHLMLGFNTFGDYQDLHRHGRIGIGAEALGQILEARVNGYFGVTPKRLIDDSNGAQTYERVADGLDYELGVPVPYLPWLKVYGSGFWYGFDHASNDFGWKTRLEARLNEYTRFEFYTWDDNKGRQEYGGRLRFSVPFNTWKDIRESFKFSHEAFPHRDLKKELLIPVERNYTIKVEKWVQSKGLTVEAGRS